MSLVVHLRLPFQVALSAVFLWGVYLASGRFGAGTWAAYLAFVVGLWGGATAFNSYYDRDEGFVGGLRHPPPVRPSLLPFSLTVQGAGLVVAWAVSVRLGALYLLSAALFAAYSHPAIRLKRYPLLSMATVATGSGALALLAGAWSAAGGIPTQARWRVGLGVAASLVEIAGFYPLTQLGHEEEDRARCDRTFRVAYGRAAAFRWALTALTIATILNVSLAAIRSGWGPATGMAAAHAMLARSVLEWRRQSELDATARADFLAYATASVYGIVVAYQAIR